MSGGNEREGGGEGKEGGKGGKGLRRRRRGAPDSGVSSLQGLRAFLTSMLLRHCPASVFLA